VTAVFALLEDGLSGNRALRTHPELVVCNRHFDRMLYDNAQLARVYMHAWQVTGNEFYRAITAGILDYAIREMTDPVGPFANAPTSRQRFYAQPVWAHTGFDWGLALKSN